MAKKKNPKAPRPRAATPRGFRDYFGSEVAARKDMLDKIAAIYQLYGFDALESSAIETVEALGKFLPDVDRPNDGVFAWQDDDETWLALRYDLTAPLARVYAQHRNDLPTPYRRFAMGPVWRNEKPGPGRFRQFYQCDADTVGAASVAADAEICAMLADTLEALGFSRGEYVVRVNNRKVLDGVLESMGQDLVSATETAGEAAATSLASAVDQPGMDRARRDDILRTIDKFDKVGEDGVRQLLTGGREDESGAFIPGVGLRDLEAEPVIRFLTSKSGTDEQTLDRLRGAVGNSQIGRAGIEELQEISSLLKARGYGPDQIVIDPSVVRGLGYYTGPVFEAELTFEIRDEKGRPRQFGAVAGGGRYDDLVKRFTGQAVPATGVSIGVDRLFAALQAQGRYETAAQGPVIVTVMDRERMSDYQAMAAELRAAGIRAEVYLGNPKNFGNQLKYADRRAAPAAIIQGTDEAARDVIQIKDLILGAKLAQEASLEEWKAQPAQREVPRAALVQEARALIERHLS